MDKVKVICPQCRTLLSFDNAPDIGDKLIVCPKCQFRATVDVYRSGTAGTGGHGANEGPTKLPEYIRKEAVMKGRLKLTDTGETFELKMGQNLIGRIAETGDADIKLSKDEYMSRRHIRIDVLESSSGLEHRLVEINSKNPTKLNEKPIPRNDILVLEFGDKLMLGRTEVVFEKPADKDDTRPFDNA
ncbi:MAG: FHA domain-containing protein [Tannerellaceae bacterium]|jgi:hypothetical protein|nr:FHA domain-containing protein [Tannerellaceae bacterium]